MHTLARRRGDTLPVPWDDCRGGWGIVLYRKGLQPRENSWLVLLAFVGYVFQEESQTQEYHSASFPVPRLTRSSRVVQQGKRIPSTLDIPRPSTRLGTLCMFIFLEIRNGVHCSTHFCSQCLGEDLCVSLWCLHKFRRFLRLREKVYSIAENSSLTAYPFQHLVHVS